MFAGAPDILGEVMPKADEGECRCDGSVLSWHFNVLSILAVTSAHLIW